jgi:tetratricopeptide (TPR) repeat protein
MYLEQRYNLRNLRAAAGGNRESWMNRERGFRLDRAAALYRKALAAPAPPPEAQIRLGRVLYLQGRLDEARSTFARLATGAEPQTRYLAALFAAGLEERASAPRAARRWYEAAMRAWPAGQAARISLARLMARDGDRAGAAALIAALPAQPSRLDARGDPWEWYHLGQAWRLEQGFVALRRDIHR